MGTQYFNTFSESTSRETQGVLATLQRLKIQLIFMILLQFIFFFTNETNNN